MMLTLPTYPKTHHIAGSGGPHTKKRLNFSLLQGKQLTIEEKVDGTHCGLFFDEQANLRVFSRNTILTQENCPGDLKELLNQAEIYLDQLWDTLGDRYVLYGEWVYAAHSIFYDQLPAYFLEDDVFDRKSNAFLDTETRKQILGGLPDYFKTPAPILYQGNFERETELLKLAGASCFKSANWRSQIPSDQKPRFIASNLAEGLYIKVEEGGFVRERYKWIQPGFLGHILNNKTHWRHQSLLRNLLNPGPG